MKKYISWLIIFALIEISLALYLTSWREHFWNATAQKQSSEFLLQLGIFTGTALIICLVSGISGYLVSLAGIKWREILNTKALTISDSRIENLNQRVQDDCLTYPDLVLNLAFGSVKALIYIITFSIALILSFHWWYLIVLVIYAIIGSIITSYIARPLIALNYTQQRVEATYRNGLTISNFQDCIVIMLGLAKKQKHLTYFQQFYGQLGVIVPLVIVAPMYFTTGMTIGTLMRFNSIGSTILDNTSYGVNSFAQINRLISCRRRLREAGIV